MKKVRDAEEVIGNMRETAMKIYGLSCLMRIDHGQDIAQVLQKHIKILIQDIEGLGSLNKRREVGYEKEAKERSGGSQEAAGRS